MMKPTPADGEKLSLPEDHTAGLLSLVAGLEDKSDPPTELIL
jgi:hypothetical protein